jgi:Icc-related predicted phosphoesterase
MKICHVSDTHTRFPELIGDYNLIVHSGDMLPNMRPRAKLQEKLFQRDWIRENGERFKTWIGEKPFLFCSGNHDYIDPCDELKDLGINAINLDNKMIEIDGVKFYGFPYVPYIGVWNWELIEREMRSAVERLVEIVDFHKIDVLVAHCPPYGILDMNMQRTHIGNVAMINAINYTIRNMPKLYLCGHAHESRGFQDLIVPRDDGNKLIKISNSATEYRILEI